MKDKRVTAAGPGGTRRHDDPPPWLNKALPLEQRRELLDRAIRALATQRAGSAEQTKKD